MPPSAFVPSLGAVGDDAAHPALQACQHVVESSGTAGEGLVVVVVGVEHGSGIGLGARRDEGEREHQEGQAAQGLHGGPGRGGRFSPARPLPVAT